MTRALRGRQPKSNVAEPSLSLTCALNYAPQPFIVRSAMMFERSLKGMLKRRETINDLPIVLSDERDEHRVSIGPQSFELTVSPLERLDRFTGTAVSLTQQFVKLTNSVTPREIELRAELQVNAPDPRRVATGYSVARFAWPRELELRPEALGKDHYLPTESGMVHLRLSTHQRRDGHLIKLLIGNRHDRVTNDPEVISQAYELCLHGLRTVINGITSPVWKRVLSPLNAPPRPKP